MEFKHTLEETLEARFTDRGEMEDIMNHGIQSGFNGFLYTYEIEAFFNEFENTKRQSINPAILIHEYLIL